MKKIKPKAFVLPTVLCLLMLMTLLSITGFEYAKMQYSIAHAYLIKNQMHIALLFELKQFEKKYQLDYQTCLVQTKTVNTYPEQTTKWWRIHGCLLTLTPYPIYFVNEKIAPHVCDKIADNKIIGLTINRITMAALTKQGKLILQTTEIEPAKNNQNCLYLTHINHFSRQAIRWL